MISEKKTWSLLFYCTHYCYSKYISPYTLLDNNNKGKEIPLQAWRGPEGSRRLKLPDFKTIGK